MSQPYIGIDMLVIIPIGMACLYKSKERIMVAIEKRDGDMTALWLALFAMLLVLVFVLLSINKNKIAANNTAKQQTPSALFLKEVQNSFKKGW